MFCVGARMTSPVCSNNEAELCRRTSQPRRSGAFASFRTSVRIVSRASKHFCRIKTVCISVPSSANRLTHPFLNICRVFVCNQQFPRQRGLLFMMVECQSSCVNSHITTGRPDPRLCSGAVATVSVVSLGCEGARRSWKEEDEGEVGSE